jgi:hypothetical protein
MSPFKRDVFNVPKIGAFWVPINVSKLCTFYQIFSLRAPFLGFFFFFFLQFPWKQYFRPLYMIIWGLISEGKLSGGVNREGIKYYNNLINELLDKGHDSTL